MYKRPKKKELGADAIPTASLADMMFMLLMFFIITTTFARTTGFVSDMPAGSKGAQQADRTTTISIQNDEIRINDQVTTMAGLVAQVRSLHLEQKTGEAKIVVLGATGKVRYQTYYEIMALIQNSGGVVAIISEDAKE